MSVQSVSRDTPATPELVTGSGVSGVAMDRKVSSSAPVWRKAMRFIPAAMLLGAVAYWLSSGNGSAALSVDSSRLSTAVVQRGIYEDYIPIRGRVTPARTVFLDAIEGGRVEKIHVEDGMMLQAGDLIVELSNSALQLDVTRNEAMVAEQLNNIRSIQLSLEQNRLQHKRNLIDINYQIKMLTRQAEQEQGLLQSNSVPVKQYQDTRDTLQWYLEQREVTLESQATDAKMQEQQLEFLQETGSQLQQNLAISRSNLDNMNVRAPVAGKLSGFDVEIGQSINRGGRLGQIDTPSDFKVTAFIDEFYLNRIGVGQQAGYEQGADTFQVEISKIYPQVRNGQFEVDLRFVDTQPSNIRRGQTLQLKLTLGDPEPALLIPNAAFYQSTGGNWIFVLDEASGQANRQDIKIGRRNNRYIEVLQGLDEGDQVVTSSYANYLQVEQLNLNQ